MTRESAIRRCERCSTEFEEDDGYANVSYVPMHDPCHQRNPSEAVVAFALCAHCKMKFDKWLDKGARELMENEAGFETR